MPKVAVMPFNFSSFIFSEKKVVRPSTLNGLNEFFSSGLIVLEPSYSFLSKGTSSEVYLFPFLKNAIRHNGCPFVRQYDNILWVNPDYPPAVDLDEFTNPCAGCGQKADNEIPKELVISFQAILELFIISFTDYILKKCFLLHPYKRQLGKL